MSLLFQNTDARDAIKANLLGGIRHRLAEAWENRLSDKDRWLIESVCQDAADLQLTALAISPHDDARHAELLREKAHIKAQLLNVAAAESVGLLAAFENSVRWAVQQVVKLAFAAI